MIYDFVTTMERPRSTEKVAGRIWVEGESYRAEFERGGAKTVVISRDGDRTATLMDVEKKTWANRSRVAGADVRSAELFLWPAPGAHVIGTPRISHRLGEASTIAGEAAVAHIIEATFQIESRVGSAPLRGTLHLTATISTSDSLPDLPMQQRHLRTGYESVDRELAKAEANVHGMVLRHDLVVTRAFEGGPPQVERTLTEIVKLERAAVAESTFVVPDDFTYTGPVTPGH
ncbi:MAG TPA: hypothetical protein VJZ00_09835 [Thermoanaerobaculia bacterium]|nr:hypothetical protein [Thermoanaerobaculia bacterium]